MSNKAQKKSLFDQRISLAFWTDCLTKNVFHIVTHLYTDAPFQQCFLDKWTKWRRVFRATVCLSVTAPVQVSRCPGVQVSHARHWTPKLMWTVRPADCRVRQSACVNPWKTAARYAQQADCGHLQHSNSGLFGTHFTFYTIIAVLCDLEIALSHTAI